MQQARVFLFDARSARPRLVVRSGRQGRGQVLQQVVLSARPGVYRLGLVDGVLASWRSQYAIWFDASFDAWYGGLQLEAARQDADQVRSGGLLDVALMVPRSG